MSELSSHTRNLRATIVLCSELYFLFWCSHVTRDVQTYMYCNYDLKELSPIINLVSYSRDHDESTLVHKYLNYPNNHHVLQRFYQDGVQNIQVYID